MEQQQPKLKSLLKKISSKKKKKVHFKEKIQEIIKIPSREKLPLEAFKIPSYALTNSKVKKILSVMQEKKSNLAFAADVETKNEFIEIVEKVGPYICLLKTHIDIIKDFDEDFILKIVYLAIKHNFLILEDRKLADIGNTVIKQCEGGIYKIAKWANFVTVHTVPGPGILEALAQVAERHDIAFILLPQMSSKGTLAKDCYTSRSLEMAEQYKEHIVGFIAREKLTSDPNFLHFTPGVKLQEGCDPLGQQYITPEQAIQKGTDIIIVGRGIIEAEDPAAMAEKYQKAGWKAYQALFEQ